MTSRIASCLSLRLVRRRVRGCSPRHRASSAGALDSGCPSRSNVGGSFETVSAFTPENKHLFECVATNVGGRFEDGLDFEAIRKYVRYRCSDAQAEEHAHRLRIRPSRPSAGYENPWRHIVSTATVDGTFGSARRSAVPSDARPAAPRLRLTKRGRGVLTTLAAAPLVFAAARVCAQRRHGHRDARRVECGVPVRHGRHRTGRSGRSRRRSLPTPIPAT